MDEARPAGTPDPRGLIGEAYRIEGIGAGECRSIFLDWLLGAADRPPVSEQVRALLAEHGRAAPDHPMTRVLREALEEGPAPAAGRRGGWRGRRGGVRKG